MRRFAKKVVYLALLSLALLESLTGREVEWKGVSIFNEGGGDFRFFVPRGEVRRVSVSLSAHSEPAPTTSFKDDQPLDQSAETIHVKSDPVRSHVSANYNKKPSNSSSKGAGKAVGAGLLRFLSPEEARLRRGIRTKVWNTLDTGVFILIQIDPASSPRGEIPSAERFASVLAHEERYVTLPFNRTVLVTTEKDPSAVILNFVTNDKNKILHIAGEGKVSPALLRRTKFETKYEKRAGKPWVGPYKSHVTSTPRDPPVLPMWPAQYEGQRHTVSTSAKHAHFCAKERSNSTPKLCASSFKANLTLSLEVLSVAPKVFLVEDFLSDDEIATIIALATPRLQSSQIGSTSAGAQTETKFEIRRSHTAWLPVSQFPALSTIYQRAADLLGIPRSLFLAYNAVVEDLQVVRYEEGGKYDGHFDWGDFGHANTRFITLLMYLNDQESDDAGGETAFLNAPQPQSMRNGTSRSADKTGFKVHPGKGNAVLFYNLLEDGNGDANTFHASLAVRKGVKWLCNLWIWDPFFQEDHLRWFQMQQRRH